MSQGASYDLCTNRGRSKKYQRLDLYLTFLSLWFLDANIEAFNTTTCACRVSRPTLDSEKDFFTSGENVQEINCVGRIDSQYSFLPHFPPICQITEIYSEPNVAYSRYMFVYMPRVTLFDTFTSITANYSYITRLQSSSSEANDNEQLRSTFDFAVASASEIWH